MSSRRVGSEVQGRREGSWIRAWLLGKGDYAHPVLRWMAMPLFRVGLVLWIIDIATSAPEWSVIWIGAAVLILVSVLADLVNALIMRARRRRATAMG